MRDDDQLTFDMPGLVVLADDDAAVVVDEPSVDEPSVDEPSPAGEPRPVGLLDRDWTPAQRAALERDGDVLVRAAAGSGKTGVLTGRIVRAVVDDDIDLARIFAVTFTEKAAQEMRSRVADELTRLGRFDDVARLEHAAITTLHGLCSRILREFGTLAGIDPRFRLLDAGQSNLLAESAMHDAFEQRATTREHHRIRARYGDGLLGGWVRDAARARRQRLDGHVTFVDPDVTTPLHQADLRFLDELLTAFEAAYARRKRGDNALDFDDLELCVLDLLDRDDVATDLRGRVDRLLVDEFQDTNAIQVRIVEALGGGRTFMVGDEWQSIYRFRRADVAVFRAMADRLGDAVIRMGENFRSAARVLDPVNVLFGRLFGERGYDPVIAALPPEAGADAVAPCELVLVRARRVNASERPTEAAAVANRIEALVADGVDPGDIAVLMARTSGADAYEQAIEARGVRTVRQASRGFFDGRHVADVTALLAWSWNARDDRAALTVLASPVASLGAAELLALRRAAPTLVEAVAGSVDPRVERARLLRDDLRLVAQAGTLVDVVDHAVHASGLASWALRGSDGLRAAANLRKLLEIAANAAAVGIDDVGGFLDLVAAQELASTEGDANVADERSGAVRLMTVHASKGLEFPYVFVVDLANAGRVGKASLLVDVDGTVATELATIDGLERSPSERLEVLQQREAEEQLEEEQRLAYVALTRAQVRTVLSGAFGVKSDGTASMRGPLRWLVPALQVDPASRSIGTTPVLGAGLDVTIVEPAETVQLPQSRLDVLGGADDLPVFAGPLEPLVTPDAWLAEQRALAAEVAAATPGTQRNGARWSLDDDGGGDARAAGTAAHAALAAMVEAPHGADFAALVRDRFGDEVAEVVELVAGSTVLAELRRRGARAELPFVAPRLPVRHDADSGATADPADPAAVSRAAAPASAADAGVLDAVVVEDGAWWVVDWKSTLPDDRATAMARHGEQLERYAAAALGAGASSVRVTLVAIDRPTVQHELVATTS